MQIRIRSLKKCNPKTTREHLQKHMIAWTMILVSCLAVISFFVLAQPPHSFASLELAARHTSLAPYNVAKNSKALQKSWQSEKSGGRSPASIAPTLSGAFTGALGALSPNAEAELNKQNMSDKDQALEIKISCADYGPDVQKLEIKSQVSHVRLSGIGCLKISGASKKAKHKAEIIESIIRNDSNGFTATVFYPNLNKFTTDYIGLRAGLNKIHVTHIYNQGEREEHDYILRKL